MVSDWKHKTVESESGAKAQKGEAESSRLLQMDSGSRSQLRLTFMQSARKVHIAVKAELLLVVSWREPFSF